MSDTEQVLTPTDIVILKAAENILNEATFRCPVTYAGGVVCTEYRHARVAISNALISTSVWLDQTTLTTSAVSIVPQPACICLERAGDNEKCELHNHSLRVIQ